MGIDFFLYLVFWWQRNEAFSKKPDLLSIYYLFTKHIDVAVIYCIGYILPFKTLAYTFMSVRDLSVGSHQKEILVWFIFTSVSTRYRLYIGLSRV